MNVSARIIASAALLVVLASTVGCNKLRSRDRLVKGINAFKNGQYELAVNDFQESIQLDPSDDTARLYLATAYSYQVVPNLDTPENLKVAQKALDGFNYVLAKNPNDVDALRQVASIDRNIKKYDQAKKDELHILAIDPQDADAAYTIGVIDWTESYKNAVTILGEAGLTDKADGNPKMSKPVCEKMVAANTDLVNDALKYLQMAVNLKANYENAMEYLNLTYRRKADLDCGDDAARKADIATADQWVQKAMGARKANEAEAEKHVQGGIHE